MPLWFLGALGWLRKAAVSLWAVVARYPWQTACIALLCLSAWCWHGWGKAEAKLKDCNTGRVADRKAYADAQKIALQKALAAKAAVEKKYAELAETTDANEQKARTDAMADAERYITAHRVRDKAAGSATGRTAAPAEDHSPASSDSAGPAPELDEVSVTADDIRICTTNTTRLEAVRSWALSLGSSTTR